MDNLKFGNSIKELRKEKNMTQKELADKIGLTDKAISKWERGLSFPDITILNSLAETFEVSVSEILNGERGEEEIDIETAIAEVVEKITNKKEKRQKTIKIIKKTVGISSSLLLGLSILLQLGYLTVIAPKGYEYVSDFIFYIVNEIIIVTFLLVEILLINLKKNNIKNIVISIICGVLTIINLAFMVNDGLRNKSIVDFSKNFANELVLKYNQETGKITYYQDVKFFMFARPKEAFRSEVEGKIKTVWLNSDICSITYKDKDGELKEFVATYGDRGDRISYTNISGSFLGEWQTYSQYGETTKLISDSKGITIKNGEKTEFFEYEDYEQFGTIAMVLYKNKIPRYVIGMNEDCRLDENTNIIKKEGTITLYEVSMEKTNPEKLKCVSNKDENLENYQIVDLNANEYIIKNGILYISYDGENIIEVPGDYNNTNEFEEGTYQISEDKTIFTCNEDGKETLLYTDTRGAGWDTKELPSGWKVRNIQFINKDIGFMLEFEDVAMGDAFGRIVKTTDGGKTWQDVYYGIGAEGEKRFKRGSNIKFVNETIGFLTMPSTPGDSSDLYITKDGGVTFDKLELVEDEQEKEIYDYYKLPKKENGTLILEVGQGADGDYNGGDSKKYISKDNGITWINSK